MNYEIQNINKSINSHFQNKTLKHSVQPKLSVNTPGDIYEQEADAMADQVMRMTSNDYAGKPMTGLIGSSVQRKCTESEEEKKKNLVMRKAESGISENTVSNSFASKLNSSKGRGSPLPHGTRNFMENAFSSDFSKVRVHTDSRASEMSRGINAKAFTYGNDIYFKDGQYSSNTYLGKKLLAHELTHVVQQNDISSTGNFKKRNQNNIIQCDKELNVYDIPLKVKISNSSGVLVLEKKADTSSEVMEIPISHLKADTYIINVKTNDGENSIFFENFRGILLDNFLTIKTIEPTLKYLINRKTPKSYSDNSKQTKEAKRKAKDYITEIKIFNNSLHQEYTRRLSVVEKLMNLQNTDIGTIVMDRLISEGFESIGEIENPATKVLAEVLKIAWDSAKLYKSAVSKNKRAIKFTDVTLELGKVFAKSIVNLEKLDSKIDQDYDVMIYLSKQKHDAKEAAKITPLSDAYEIGIWKETLALNWNHMRSSSGTFYKTRKEALNIASKIQAKNPHTWHTIKPGSEFMRGDGYFLYEHWLGKGGTAYYHNTPDVSLTNRIFNDLKVSKEEVFTKWGLPIQYFVIPVMTR